MTPFARARCLALAACLLYAGTLDVPQAAQARAHGRYRAVAALPSPIETKGLPGTTLGRPHFDTAQRLLILPFKGDEPAYVRGALRLPPRVYFDFDAGAPGVGALSEVVFDHPTLLGWAMSPHVAHSRKTRLTFIFKRPTAVSVTLDARHHALVLVPAMAFAEQPKEPSPRPTRAPTSPQPSPVLIGIPALDTTPSIEPMAVSSTSYQLLQPTTLPEPAPSPSPSPTPAPTPPPLPSPSPTPTPAPVLRGWRAQGAFPFYSYDENYPAAGLASHADLLLAQGARLCVAPWPDWEARLDTQVLAIAYQDTAKALYARHEWDLGASLLHELPVAGVDAKLGLSYMARYQAIQAANGTTGYAAAPWRLAHGPSVVGGLRLPVIDASGWDVRLDAGLTPALFSLLPAGTAALPWIWGYQLELALDVPVGPLLLGAGYRRAAYSGSGYSEILEGPFVALGGTWGP